MKLLTSNAHWLLRIALASVFVYHGVLKFQNLEGFATAEVKNTQTDQLPTSASALAG
jgi:uncharacterized membrane protein YphA (DoxX/SURF4 family)